MRVMERTFRQQLFFLLLCLSVLKGDCRYIENNDISKDELFSLLSSDLRREIPELLMYRRPLRCLDMVAVEGQFTFTAETPQLSCAAFFMAEPNELITVEFDSVDVDCSGGDFVTMFDGWVMKGEKFPSSQDHPLPLYERYVNYCDSGAARKSMRSSQNVAMVFFRVHGAGSSFALTVRKHVNPFPCNVISQSPEGSYTMVTPQQHRNCSFSIIYPVAIDISEFSLGHHSNFPKRSLPGCAESGDYVQLLGGSGIDTSKLLPITDLCISFTGPTHMKIGCDNTVVRMVSSGRFVSRVSFSYRPLDSQELQTIKLNNVEDFCFNN
ncbi:PREDICTED: corticotropin-releasing factor-binding protein [Poecilia mexicana]|uniref:Corticotropin-releasing factor-binding protein n=2 Tax=Poecilia TaxID=8080 RepID=A0A087XT68_POEFO|nr:PREDICTED: corticotropin-releasing factor-binding protein [Poecilia formosa]XP_014860689.1 PREDICTED: corticotropin-releasing factor-binding protein [Poecilia mexicana]